MKHLTPTKAQGLRLTYCSFRNQNSNILLLKTLFGCLIFAGLAACSTSSGHFSAGMSENKATYGASVKVNRTQSWALPRSSRVYIMQPSTAGAVSAMPRMSHEINNQLGRVISHRVDAIQVADANMPLAAALRQAQNLGFGVLLAPSIVAVSDNFSSLSELSEGLGLAHAPNARFGVDKLQLSLHLYDVNSGAKIASMAASAKGKLGVFARQNRRPNLLIHDTVTALVDALAPHQ